MTDPQNQALARLGEIADLLLDCRTALNKAAHDTRWVPAQPSGADLVHRQLSALPPPPSGRTHLATIDDVVQTYLVTAGEHLGALAAMYRAGEVSVTAASVARSVIEASARAMWVIGEPGDLKAFGSEVLARAMLEENLSAEEANKAAQRMGRKTDASAVAAKANLKRVRADSEALLDGTTTMQDLTSSPARFNSETRPSPSDAVVWMWELLSRGAGSTVDSRTALGMYDFLSSNTHPTLYALRQARQWVEHDGHRHGRIVLDVGYRERIAGAAVVVFYNALSYAMGFYEVDRAAHRWLTGRIDTALPAVFRPEPANDNTAEPQGGS